MTSAYWYVFIAFLLPYLFAILAKAAAPGFDNEKPRTFLASLEGWRQRAHWTQLNSFEAFPPFAAAVIIAHLQNAQQAHIDLLALGFLACRIFYGFMYITNQATLRSLAFFGAFGCVIGLFIIAAQ